MPKHRPAHEIVLNALEVGKQVELDGQTTIMEGGHLLFRVKWKFGTDEWEDAWIDPHVTLSWFIKACEKLSFDELFILSCETALMKMKREGPRI